MTDEEWKPHDYNMQSDDGESDEDVEESQADFERRILKAGQSVSRLMDDIPIPSQLHGTLKDFQEVGFRWLVTLYERGMNGILADEMGCGKTVQCLTFLLYLQHVKRIKHNVLIVVPLSVLKNWIDEGKKFAPSLEMLAYHGDREERQQLQQRILGSRGNSLFIVTNYEGVNRDIDFFKRVQFDYLVVDEAHRLKNRKSQLYGNLVSVCERKLLMTGTPIQNNLEELNALLHFTNPTLFHALPKRFVSWYDTTKLDSSSRTSERVHKLQDIIRPFVLRREKEQVIPNLPIKKEVVMYAGISDVQKRLYKAILTKDLSAFENNRRTALNNVLMQLRKCVNHPYLFPGVEPEPFEMGSHLINASGKLWLLDHLLRHFKQHGHRVLIFSQMTGVLDIVQDYLDYREYTYERLDGSIRGDDRYKAVDRYQSSTGDGPFIFLLTTRAGGVGLNLVGADTIIFFDSDFNPQADLQAASRAHRIGQTKPVLVLRLIARGTVEEVIFARAQRKLKLTHSVLKRGQFMGTSQQQDSVEASAQSDDLSVILKFGLEGLLQNEQSTISDSDLDQILSLDRGSTVPSVETSQETVAVLEEALAPEDQSIYVYGGQDYSKAKPDQDAFQKLKQDFLDSGRRGLKRTGDVSFDDEYQRLEMERLERRKESDRKRREKLERMWQENHYTSTKLVVSASDELERDSVDIEYVRGDLTKPADSRGPVIIVHSVDNSGEWTDRGLFRSLSKLSTSIEEAYSLAHQMKDLHYEDVHLIRVPDADVARHCGRNHQQQPVHVALIVAQKRDRSGAVSDIHIETLNEGLKLIGTKALELKASVHLPRFGQSLDDFDWYQTERIIKKQLAHRGIKPYVYYFGRRQYNPSASTNQSSSRSIPAASVPPVSIQDVAAIDLKEDLFDGDCIYFAYESQDDADVVKQLKRYVYACGGKVSEKETSGGNVLVLFPSFHGDLPMRQMPVVSAHWIVDSIASKKRMNTDFYLIAH